MLLDTLAGALTLHGDLSRAEILLDEAVRLSQQLDDVGLLIESAFKLGVLAARRGDHRRAIVLQEACAVTRRRTGHAESSSNHRLAEQFLVGVAERLTPEDLAAARDLGGRLLPGELADFARAFRAAGPGTG